jgi:hypothetical protein
MRPAYILCEATTNDTATIQRMDQVKTLPTGLSLNSEQNQLDHLI